MLNHYLWLLNLLRASRSWRAANNNPLTTIAWVLMEPIGLHGKVAVHLETYSRADSRESGVAEQTSRQARWRCASAERCKESSTCPGTAKSAGKGGVVVTRSGRCLSLARSLLGRQFRCEIAPPRSEDEKSPG